jgi:hypothetical protein
VISIAKFKKDIWYNEMKSILSRLEGNIERERLDESAARDMTLIYNEIDEELLFTPLVTFDLSLIDPDNITYAAIDTARNYIERIRRYYIDVSKNAVDARDITITAMERADKEGFIRMKKQYTNESLEEFVTNDNEKDKIKRFKDRLYQNYDQVFFDPPGKLIKAHFYAPRKQIFGNYMSTLAVNAGVIWLMTILLYILLYFRALHRLLESSNKALRAFRGAEHQ